MAPSLFHRAGIRRFSPAANDLGRLPLDRGEIAPYTAAMTQAQSFLSEIEKFLVISRMRASTFGHKTVNDGKLVDRLRDGGSVTLTTAERIRKFIAAQTEELEDAKPRRRVA